LISTCKRTPTGTIHVVILELSSSKHMVLSCHCFICPDAFPSSFRLDGSLLLLVSILPPTCPYLNRKQYCL
jgi:hypothetical protein